jgi:thioredoxin
MKNLKIIFFALGSFFWAACSNGQQSAAQLDALAFQKSIAENPNAVILDVRTASELKSGFIAKAVHMDWNDKSVEQEMLKLDKSKSYYVYCLSGGRSSSAADLLRSNGFANVYELKGGIMKWRAANLPLVTENQEPLSQGMSKKDYDLLLAKDKIVLIDFYADWCAPCKKMAPYLAEMKEEYAGKVEIVRIDADKNLELCRALGIDALPVVYIYKNGTKTFEHLGFISKEDLQKEL